MKSRLLGVVCLYLLTFCLSTSSYAAIIVYEFSGSINQITDPDNLLGDVSIAAFTSTFTGTFTYDDLESPTHNFSTSSRYPGIGLAVQVDDTYNFVANEPGIQIGNNAGSRDHFSIAGIEPDTVFDIDIGDWELIQVFLSDSSETVFSNLSLPSSIDLADFDGRKLYLRGGIKGASPGSLDSQYIIDGVITSLSPQLVPVPEPGTALLFGTGIISLMGMRLTRRLKGWLRCGLA